MIEIVHVFERDPLTHNVGLLWGTYTNWDLAVNNLTKFCKAYDGPNFENRHFLIRKEVAFETMEDSELEEFRTWVLNTEKNQLCRVSWDSDKQALETINGV